jgi:hypothetical protein
MQAIYAVYDGQCLCLCCKGLVCFCCHISFPSMLHFIAHMSRMCYTSCWEPLDTQLFERPGFNQWRVHSSTSNTCASLAAEGFGVGHTRSTQTKGVWVWGEPQKLPFADKTLPEFGGQEASIVYLDTEGFESTGKADAYDDRIFALSTLISAVLVYNLPETVRESDIQKLSFAVELAEGFYADVQVSLPMSTAWLNLQ